MESALPRIWLTTGPRLPRESSSAESSRKQWTTCTGPASASTFSSLLGVRDLTRIVQRLGIMSLAPHLPLSRLSSSSDRPEYTSLLSCLAAAARTSSGTLAAGNSGPGSSDFRPNWPNGRELGFLPN